MSISYLDGLKYQLVGTKKLWIPELAGLSRSEDATCEWITLTVAGCLIIKNGYTWDGCSGPTWDTPSTMTASLVHDALYQLIRKELVPASYKQFADTIFYNQMIKDGVWRLRAKAFYKAVDRWGTPATLPSHKRKLKFAP